MKRFICNSTLSLMLLMMPAMAMGAEQELAQKKLQCMVGPVTKTYGTAPWLIYSCDDHRSIVIISAPGNPAIPFYFTYYFRNGTYQLHGEGTGDKKITDAAYSELRMLFPADIEALIAQTEKH